VKVIQLQIHSDHHDVICTKQQSKNLKQQTLCQIKPCELQTSKLKFNSKTIYNKQRTSTHVTEKSLSLDLSFNNGTPP